MTPVSGRAVVVGCTVNEQQWLPDFPPPYVVAIVAIEEDPGVRLTTNIVGCPVADVHIGMCVRVRFEKNDEVYLPFFEPDPNRLGQRTALPEPRDYKASIRSRASSKKFEDAVALTGVGQSEVGRRLMRDPLSLTVDACVNAAEDAGLALDEIDGLSTFPGAAPGGCPRAA